MNHAYKREVAVAVAAVRLAAQVCRAVQAKLVTADALAKRDRSPVTVADFASQALICQALAGAFPNDAVTAEETTAELRLDAQAAIRAAVIEHVSQALNQSVGESQVLDWIDRGGHEACTQRFWTLDPIDGTKGFLRKEQYAIALALLEEGRVVMGVLGCPGLPSPAPIHGPGMILLALRGQGTRLLPMTGERLDGPAVCVSTVKDPAQSRFCESVDVGHSNQSDTARIAARMGITAPPLRMDSQAKYAVVAQGLASLYLRLPVSATYQEKIWDHAAGSLVVQEAGGEVSDMAGKPLDFARGRTLSANRGVVASNGALHQAALSALAAVMPQD